MLLKKTQKIWECTFKELTKEPVHDFNDRLLLDLQLFPKQFTADCEASGVRVNTPKSKVMILCLKTVDGPLRLGTNNFLRWRT